MRVSKLTFAENFLEFARLKGRRIKLYPYQREILRDKSRFRIIAKARQIGISWILAYEGLMRALTNRNYTVLFVSNSQKNANRILQYIYDFIYSLPPPMQPDMSEAQSKTEICFPTKSRIISLPNNPNTARGYPADSCYWDEAAHFATPGDKEMMDALRPSIARGGQLTLFSTPMGQLNEFFKIWEERSEYSHHQIDWTKCPDSEYKKNVLADKEQMDPISFSQEYDCVFVGESTAYFPYKLIMASTSEDLEMWSEETEPQTSGSVFMGIDFGKIRSSTAVAVIEQINEKVKLRFVKEYIKTEYSTQLGEIKRLAQRFPILKILVDQTGIGIRLYEELRQSLGAKVIPITFTAQSKEKMITNLYLLMEDGNIILPKHDRLISQLQTLERQLTDSGNVKFKHQVGKMDDIVWALSLACESIQREQVPDLIWFGVGSWHDDEDN